MAINTDFTSDFSFNLPDEALRKLRRSSFLTGTTPGPEFTKAVVEGALEPLANLASERERYARQFALQEEGLRLEEQNIANINAYRQGALALDYDRMKQQERSQRLGLVSGALSTLGMFAFMPGNKSTTTTVGNVATTVTPSVLSNIGSGVINTFKKIWGWIT
jgi:hypothetical protein